MQFSSDDPLSILIVEDHQLIRIGLCEILQGIHLGAVSISEADSIAAAEKSVDEASRPVNLVLLDLNLPDSEGIETLVRFRRRYPSVAVSLLTGVVEREIILRAYEIGISGFIPKASSPSVMQAAVKLILNGGVYIPKEIFSCFEAGVGVGDNKAPILHPDSSSLLPPRIRLTNRQREVAQLMCLGMSNKEISRELDMAFGTVKNHIASILRLVGTNSRAKAISMLIRILEQSETVG